SRTRATIAWTWASSVVSATMPSASPPRVRIHSAHCCALSSTTSTHATRAPSSARPCAMPPPMLGLVPVTIATLPESFTAGGSAREAVRAERRQGGARSATDDLVGQEASEQRAQRDATVRGDHPGVLEAGDTPRDRVTVVRHRTHAHAVLHHGDV